MVQKKDDEIMAEYLLKGGKMLEKSCPVCGCPLFEYKKKTFCVVCAEKKTESAPVQASTATTIPGTPAPAVSPNIPVRQSPESEMVSRELSGALVVLCQRIKNDEDPDHNLLLMDAVKTGTEALLNLRQL